MKKRVMLAYGIFILLIMISASAAPSYYANKLILPHIYPGQEINSTDRWQMEPLHVKSSTVRWTELGAYSINLDKIHLDRKSYTIILKSKFGPEIKFIPFTETELVVGNEIYEIHYDKKNYTLWISKYVK